MSQDLTPAEAAQQLRCSDQFIYNLCAAGKLRSYRNGRRVIIFAGEIERYKEAHAQAPPSRPTYRR